MRRSRTAGVLARSGSDGALALALSENGLVAGAAADGDVRAPFGSDFGFGVCSMFSSSRLISSVPCRTRKVIGVDFQGRCIRLLVSAVAVGRVPPPHGERANVEDAASGDAAYNSTRPDDAGRFWAVGLDWVVEREGVIKCITVIHLITGCTGGSCGNAVVCHWRRASSRIPFAGRPNIGW